MDSLGVRLFINSIPELIGREMVRNSINNFDTESFNGKSWKRSSSEKTLQKTGKLLNDVKNSKISKTPMGATLEVINDYGIFHNDGVDVEQRQFIGWSDKLLLEIDTLIDIKINNLI